MNFSQYESHIDSLERVHYLHSSHIISPLVLLQIPYKKQLPVKLVDNYLVIWGPHVCKLG